MMPFVGRDGGDQRECSEVGSPQVNIDAIGVSPVAEVDSADRAAGAVVDGIRPWIACTDDEVTPHVIRDRGNVEIDRQGRASARKQVHPVVGHNVAIAGVETKPVCRVPGRNHLAVICPVLPDSPLPARDRRESPGRVGKGIQNVRLQGCCACHKKNRKNRSPHASSRSPGHTAGGTEEQYARPMDKVEV